MSTNQIDVQKKIRSFDQRLISSLISRFEYLGYAAEAKYIILKDFEKITRESKKEKEKIINYYRRNAYLMAKRKGIDQPEIFSEFIVRIVSQILDFSIEYEKEFLKKKYFQKKQIN